MKIKILLTTLLTGLSFLNGIGQTTFTIAPSFPNWLPAEQTITAGDKITFATDESHPVVEVTEATWNNNGNAPKSSGFSCPSNCTLTFADPGTYYYVCAFHFSSGMKGKIIVQSAPLGIGKSESFPGDFKVYPNPAESRISIDLAQSLYVNSVTLVNSQGQEVVNSLINKSLNVCDLDLNGLEAGLYQVIVSTSTKKLYSKVVVR